MSSADDIATEATDVKCCASCDIAEVDDIKLEKCDDCDLVRHCSDTCEQDHRPNHEAMCKNRAAELRDELLFRQPESSYLGDCPICCLPLPLDPKKSVSYFCCSKVICNGCNIANVSREYKQKLNIRCPFCRHLYAKSEEENERRRKKRFEANDPFALREAGRKHFGDGDYERAFEYWTKAADLGDANAHLKLAIMYVDGKGVEKDEEKEIYHLEEAAIAGHPQPRKNLAFHEFKSGRVDNAVKHLIIAANLGDDDSIQSLKTCYVRGHVSKHNFASALRAHQAAVDATKSPQRDAAEEYY